MLFGDSERDELKYANACQKRLERTMKQAVANGEGGDISDNVFGGFEALIERQFKLKEELLDPKKRRTVGVIILIAGLAASGSFFSSNITGNVIAGLGSSTGNLIGGVGLVLACAGAFLFLRA
jgi:hypothetical protein